ncbi:MarR family transcriptional regulator [Staphylococcus sp. SQ8-PEA]|uniref:HTH-type transcriptional regulator SarZ n=1 Tax=Staphylococcus marylandisciuri TaxID=2981529 RepID=A0ABT2QSH8_9STAP|nr:MarR family transcriptional regulator [Staphylococcus marylandisciuri]MCU5746929.1 MarR family transcriptional regulator [Staphylococcus marylandisciuri]
MKLANQLCFSVYNVNRLFGQFYEKQLKRFGLTFSQYLVLLALWEKQPQTLNAIGKQLDLASNTLTPLLRRLEQAGWITRYRSESDKRQLHVSLTEKGQREQTAVYQAISECISTQFNLEEYQQAKTVLDNLEDKLKHL